MAIQTATHCQVYRSLCNGGLGEIPVTSCTDNACLIMRRMAKFNVRIWREAVDAYPRNLDILSCISNHFLYFRFFPRELGVTEHALLNGWNTGSIANIGAGMAVDTLHSQLHMSVVRECDRLLDRSGNGAKSEKPQRPGGVSKKSPRQGIRQTCVFSNGYQRLWVWRCLNACPELVPGRRARRERFPLIAKARDSLSQVRFKISKTSIVGAIA